MHILMLLGEEFPPDDRVEKEARSFMEQGFRVTIACHTRQERPSVEEINGLRVCRMRISPWQYKLGAACLIVPGFFRRWKAFAESIVKNDTVDIIHVHDLPLSSVGYYLKKKYGAKLICDQHEFYSNWIVHTAHYNTPVGKMVKWLSNWKGYERKYLNRADLVITVEEPLRRIYINKVGIDPSKIICLRNVPSSKVFDSGIIDDNIIRRFKDRFVLFYAGNIDILRGVDVAVKALPLIKKVIPNVMLLLCGNIRKPCDPLAMARMLGVGDNICFDGWSPVDKLPSYIYASDMCFFTPPANREEINRTIATKIYQYLQMGKPVIVGQAKMMKDFVEKYGIGYVINDESHVEFAQAVIDFQNNRQAEEARIRKNCFVIRKQFVWEDQFNGLIEQYKAVKIIFACPAAD